MNRVQKQMNAFLEVSRAHWEPGLRPEIGRGPPSSWEWAQGGGPSHAPTRAQVWGAHSHLLCPPLVPACPCFVAMGLVSCLWGLGLLVGSDWLGFVLQLLQLPT